MTMMAATQLTQVTPNWDDKYWETPNINQEKNQINNQEEETDWWDNDDFDIKPLETFSDEPEYKDDKKVEIDIIKDEKHHENHYDHICHKEKSNTQILVEKIYDLLKADYYKFKDISINLHKKGGYMHSLTLESNYVEPFGFIGIALKKAEEYYTKHNQKPNISRIRAEIDGIQTNLRIALTQNDYKNQEKLCLRLMHHKKLLQDALDYAELIKTKATPLDLIRESISIISSSQGKSQSFYNLFKSYCKSQK